jgi:hypothetical protein
MTENEKHITTSKTAIAGLLLAILGSFDNPLRAWATENPELAGAAIGALMVGLRKLTDSAVRFLPK